MKKLTSHKFIAQKKIAVKFNSEVNVKALFHNFDK